MKESEVLHKKADRLVELASTLQEIRDVLFDQAKVLRFNAGLQWRSEERKHSLPADEPREGEAHE